MYFPNALECPTLDHSNQDPYLNVALEAALRGGRIVLDFFNQGVEIRSKQDEASYNLVSDADIQSEQAIVSWIQSQFPEHEILGEEESIGNVDARDLWIVDPLDGTNNFAHRIPHFAVSIGYYHQGKPYAGVVVNPVRNDWYWAVKGQGAFHNGHPLKVDSSDALSSSLVGCGFYYDRGAMMEATLAAIHDFFKQDIHGIRRFGTAALDFCQVASGCFGAFFEYQLHPWDFAAGLLILEEAGGQVTDGRGGVVPLKRTSVLASNSLLHAKCLDIVSRHHP